MSTGGDLACVQGVHKHKTPEANVVRLGGLVTQERVWLPGVGTEVRHAEARASGTGVGASARHIGTGSARTGRGTRTRHRRLGTAGTSLRSRTGNDCPCAVGAGLRACARHHHTSAVRSCGRSGTRGHRRRAVRAGGCARPRRACGGTIGTGNGARGGALDAARRRRVRSRERCKGNRRRSSAGEEDLSHEVFSHGRWVPPANLLET